MALEAYAAPYCVNAEKDMFSVMELNNEASLRVRCGDSVGVIGPGMYRERSVGDTSAGSVHRLRGPADFIFKDGMPVRFH